MTQPKVDDVKPAQADNPAAETVDGFAPAGADFCHALQRAWREGMESGDFAALDMDAIKAEGRRYLASKV